MHFLSRWLIPFSSHPHGRRRGRVHKDVVFLKSLDVGLNLVHLGLKDFLAGLLADSIELAVMALLLVVAHEDLPLLLESGDQLLALLLGHQHTLAVSLVLLLNLHLTNEVVLVLDFLFDLSDILGHSAVGLLLKHVILFGRGELGGGEDVLHRVGYNEVLVRDEAVDGLLVTLRHSSLLLACALDFCDFFLGNQNRVTCASLSKAGLVSPKGSLSSTEGGTTGLVRVSTALEVELARKVSAHGF